MSEAKNLSATGRRKNAVARVRLTEGTGQIVINGRSFEEYLPTLPLTIPAGPVAVNLRPNSQTSPSPW